MIWAILAAGAAIAGGVAGAVAKSRESKAAEKTALQNKKYTEEQYALELSDLQTQQKRFAGQQKTLIGRAGVKLTSGSPLALQAETARAMAEDQRRLQLQGEFEAGQYGEEAKTYKKTRPWQVGASLLGGFGQGASYFM
jgi:hypothetical protein